MTPPRPALLNVLPGPRPAPLLGWRGNLLAFVRDPIAHATQLFERYGDLVALSHGASKLVLVLGPAYNQALLAQPAVFRSAIGLAAAPGGDTLKSALQAIVERPDEPWIGSYRRIVAETTRVACERWGIGQQLDAAWSMQRLTVRIAARALWGLERSEDVAALLQATAAWHVANPARMVIGASIEVPGTPFHSLAGLVRRIEQAIGAAYGAARARSMQPYAPDSLMARLAAVAPEAEAIALLAHLFAAGYPAVAAALAWTLFLLTQHAAVQAELHTEARLAAVGDEPGVEQLARLELLERTVRESLRLFPPCAFGMRSLAQPATLGGYALPEGAMVVYSPYLTHRLPERYFWPHRFRPERWLHVEPAPAEYLPFGGAPRATLGTELAELEIRIVLSVVLRRFVFGLAPGARIDPAVRVALLPRNGLPVVISPPDRPVRRREPHGGVLQMVEL